MQIGILKNTVTVELCQQLLVQLKVPAMANAFAKLATDLSSDMRVDPSDDIRTDPPISRFMQVYCS